MAKKAKAELTPEQLEAKKIKKQRRSERWTKFWAIVLALVLVAGVCFGAKTMATKAAADAQQQEETTDANNNAAPVNNNTTPANNTTPDNNTTPADNNTTPADNNTTPADNSGNNGGEQQPQQSPAQIINAAMAAAEGAGYTWSRTGNISNLKVPFQNMLKGVLESKNTTLEAVVGGFLGAKGNTETVTRGKGETPKNEEGTDTYYHWDQYKIIKTSVTDDDLKGLQVNGNQYTFTLDPVVNPEAGNSGFSRFTNDFVTLDMINTELAGQNVGIKVDAMTATYGPMNVTMTIENGKVTALHYEYVANVNPLQLLGVIKATGDMKVVADYTNFQY
jgi:hypothetical protein